MIIKEQKMSEFTIIICVILQKLVLTFILTFYTKSDRRYKKIFD